jgi:Icc protein
LSTPSTSAQYLPGSEFFALDDRPAGMRWLELYDDGRIETEVTWVAGEARS